MLLLSLLSYAFAETQFVTAPTQAVRWPGDAMVTVTLAAGDPVEVVVRDGALARIRKGGDFGWVDATMLAAEAPRPADTPSVPELPVE